MLKQALIFATILSVLVVGGIAAFSGYQQKLQIAKLRSELAAVKSAAEVQTSQAARLAQDLTNRQERIEALIREKEQVTRAQTHMETQMRAALQSKDITISELQGKLTVTELK